MSDEVGAPPGDAGAGAPPWLPMLDRPELARLWAAARARVERRGRVLGATPVRLTGLDPAAVDAICGVLGRRRPRGTALNVDLRHLDAALRASVAGVGLLDVLVAIGGPLRDLAAERDGALAARAQVWAGALGHPACDDRRVRDWVESLRARGRLTRLAAEDPARLLVDALDVLAGLLDAPAGEPLPLAVVAARRFGDAHALDPGTDLGLLVADAARAVAGCDDERRAWRCLGVELDQVAVSALALNLPGLPGTVCAAAGAAGEPLRVTARMLRRGVGLDPARLRRVWVCENPAIVALAADRLGAGSEPLMCTEGMPSSAVATLLGLLATAGAHLRVHADFDAGGVAIAGYVIGRFDAAPWRFGRRAYLEAIACWPSVPLAGRAGATPWDPGLDSAINEHRRAVHEEALAATLLPDLAR